jgi:REP element-mobilizing transposase RayT
MLWRHVMVNTHCTWLPGERKGFRNRKHRIHSSGDYKNPPPRLEHLGLRDFNLRRAGKPVEIPKEVRERIGRAFIKRLRREGYTVLAVAVSAEHVHALVELPNHRGRIREISGRCKQYGTRAARPPMTGEVWADGGEFKPVRNRSHQLNVYEYILTRQGPWAWTWSFRDELGLERFPKHLFPHRYGGKRRRSPGPAHGRWDRRA